MTTLFDRNPTALRLGPFGSEYFSVTGFTSNQFSFNQSYKTTVFFTVRQHFSPQEVLHKSACLNWGDNYIHGVISESSSKSVTINSPLYPLSLIQHSRVYANMDFEKLIKTVLENNNWGYKQDFKFLLSTEYPSYKYTAQYQETDVEFIQRQCSRWGIFFGFIQCKERAVLVFCDDSKKFAQQFPEIEIPYELFSQYKLCRKVLNKSVKISDYNPDTPDLDLSMEIDSREIGYGCDDRLYEFYQTRELGEVILKRRLEYYDCTREVIFAETDNLNLKLGQRINSKNKSYISELKYHIDILTNQRHITLTLRDSSRAYRPELPRLFRMPDVAAHIISSKVDQSGRYYISPDYDEWHEINTYPVRLSQPCTGNNIGFHFPLIKNTKVFITHINGDPDRPVILGVMPCEERPSLVTGENNLHHVLKTPVGNQWFMDDSEEQSALKFNATDDQAVINLLADQIKLAADQNIEINAEHEISQKAENYNQAIGGDHNIAIKNNYGIQAIQSDMAFSSGQDLSLSSQQISVNCPKAINIVAEKGINVSAKQLSVEANQADIKASNTIKINSSTLSLSSNSKIIIAVGGSSIVISQAGIMINAKSVNFLGAVSSPLGQLGGSGSQSVSNTLNLSQFNLNYINLENRFAPYAISRGEDVLWSGCVREKNAIHNIDLSQPLTVKHKDLPVIAVDGKPQKPAEEYKLFPQLHKQHQINLLSQPKYKKISHNNNQFHCELLTEAEIKYFKENNNNSIIVFIHGYNVEAGHFGDYSYIRTPQEGFDNDTVNGTGAPNWLLHMEYNLNCAAQNSYLEFPWEEHALDYKRILGVHWHGCQNIYDIPYSSGLNFAGMEFNAIGSGYGLIPLIKQLKSAGLKINIIAHSLGCLTAIQLMDLLGREHQCLINHVILWEPAVASSALSPIVINSLEQKRTAVKETLEGEAGSLIFSPLILYNYYGEYLRQKAAKFKHIPLWDLYEKDPFAYFPYASRASQKIHVLYSQHDDVLKYDYRLNNMFASLPHYNFMFNPMGLYGADTETFKLLKAKLVCTDQQDWLLGHSDMKIPIKALFDHVYKLIITEIWSV
ncbi:MAG TPA: contractile injection system protein, VgrG/Pvc8 family [Gammaproteobacteria bacterium]|nr:contractile injection system protein, VgrG/Pvc8 family [Gammaproteobacteria bacterium]